MRFIEVQEFSWHEDPYIKTKQTSINVDEISYVQAVADQIHKDCRAIVLKNKEKILVVDSYKNIISKIVTAQTAKEVK